MSAVLELNRALLVSRAEMAAAAVRGDGSEASGQPSRTSLLEGLLARVSIPKRDWERLVISVVPAVSVGASPAEYVDPNTERGREIVRRTAELKASIERGTSTAFYRVGVVQSVVFHAAVAGQPPTPYFLVDLGDSKETFTLKQCHERPHESPDDEISLLTKLMIMYGKPLLSADRHSTLSEHLQCLKQHSSGVGAAGSIPAGCFAFSSTQAAFRSDGSTNVPDTQAQKQKGSSSDAEVFLVRQQRELIQQLKQDVEQKNRELYQMSLQMRAQQQQADDEVKRLAAQLQSLAEMHGQKIKEHELREAKMRPLIDAVKPLNQLLKLAREKLGMPQGSLEAVERALREASVVPRGAPS